MVDEQKKLLEKEFHQEYSILLFLKISVLSFQCS